MIKSFVESFAGKFKNWCIYKFYDKEIFMRSAFYSFDKKKYKNKLVYWF